MTIFVGIYRAKRNIPNRECDYQEFKIDFDDVAAETIKLDKRHAICTTLVGW